MRRRRPFSAALRWSLGLWLLAALAAVIVQASGAAPAPGEAGKAALDQAVRVAMISTPRPGGHSNRPQCELD